MNLKTNTKIESIYDFLDESEYPYLSNDEEYKEKQFEVDYNGLKLIVTRSNNMDADDEQLIPNTFSYFIKVGGRVINNSAKDVPKILDYLKSRFDDGGLTMKAPKLLAPNGKPSNLTPEQYRLVRTPAFKAWFGDWELLYQYKDRYTYEGHDRLFDKPKIGNEYDLVDGTKAKLLSLDKEKGQYEVLINGKKQFISFSKMLYLYSGIPDVFTEERLSEISKVVDENGEPLVVYHGTNYSEFNEFDDSYIGDNTGNAKSGFYFTNNYLSALSYTESDWDWREEDEKEESTDERDVFYCFLNIRNPLEKNYSNKGLVKESDWSFSDLALEKNKDGAIQYNIIDNWSFGTKNKKKDYIGNNYIVFEPNQIKLADGTNTTFDSNNPDIRYKKGGSVKNLSKTPAPKKDRIYGSSKNKPKSSESKSKASSIILNPTVIKSINTILKEHNEDFPKKKIPLSTAKAVVRRGMGAFSSSYRPTISGGKPNSRVAWGLARLKAFVYKIQKGYSKSGKYKQDNDLIEELGYNYKKYKNGGEMELDNLYKEHHEVWAKSEEIIKNVCEENCSKYSTEIYNLYETDLKAHFVEEEKVFFPSVINERNKDLIKELIREHHLIKFLVQKIRLSKRTKDIKDFCNLMIEHISKEELIMKTISNDPYKDMAFKNGGLTQEEYKYFLVIKNQKPVFKVKFSEYRKETERDMSEMLDKLYDMDYSLKPITEQEYKDFDYSTVDKEDIAEFTKNWSYYKNGGKITDEKKETYKKWKGLVNMSSSELNKFLDSEEGKVAGLSRKKANELGIDYGRESARWILRMKDTPYSEWTPNMWRWAKKQISFISRMSGNKGKLFDENGKRTRKYLSLLVWGNNPLK